MNLKKHNLIYIAGRYTNAMGSPIHIYKRFENAFYKAYDYAKQNGWLGYDPYDGLNSEITSSIGKISKWLRVAIIQFNKRSHFNFRPILRIKPSIDIKGMGLFAKSLLVAYEITRDNLFLQDAKYCLNYLKQISLMNSYGYYCWYGHPFIIQTPKESFEPSVPKTVATVTCALAFIKNYELTEDEEFLEIAKSSANFIVDSLYVNNGEKSFFKYTPLSEPNTIVYNASTHAVMLLSNLNKYIKDNKNFEIAKKVMNYIISKQKSNGAWYYSETDGNERMQIDFHQGFILDGLYDFIKYTQPKDDKYMNTLLKGAEFYRKEQFLPDGRCKWRWPRVWPIDIHNQAQGILTFSKLSEIKPDYLDFAKKIALWTIKNMQDESGYFYYQKHRFYINKIPYMRWGQAWMMLALGSLLEAMENQK